MKTNFEKLDETKHMLQWFSQEPYNEIVSFLEEMFNEQVPNTKLLEFHVASKPEWLNGGRENKKDNTMIVSRSAVAFLCEFVLENSQDIYPLKGVFSWVVVNLDRNPKHQQWMDLDGTLDEFGSKGLLKERIYLELE